MAAHLVDHAHRNAGAIEIGVEQAQPLGLALDAVERRGAGEDENLVRDLRGGNPDLLARQQIVIAAPLGAHLDGRGIETGVGLGHGEAGFVVAGNQRRKHAPLLFVRSEHDDRLEAEDVDVNRRCSAHGGAGFGDRLHHDHSFGDAEAGPPVCFRHRNAEPAGRGERGMQLVREVAAAVLLQPIRVVKLHTELADLVPDLLLLRAQ